MAIQLLQSQTGQEIVLGPFLSDTDGKTQMTELTIANTDIKLWKNGATTLVNKNAGGATHVGQGRYLATLDATDTNTWGALEVYCHMSGTLPVQKECHVGVLDVLGLAPMSGVQPQGDALFAYFGQYRPARVLSPSSTTQFTFEPIGFFIDGLTRDDYFNGWTVSFGGFSGSGLGFSQVVDYSAATNLLIVSPALAGIPGPGTLFILVPPHLSNATLATTAALATVQGLVDDLETRLTAARAGYLDNLSGGAVATAANLSTVAGYVDTEVAAIKAKTDNLPASPAAVGSAMTLADGAITEVKISSGGLNAIADALLKRDFSAVTGEAARSMLNALRFLRNRFAVSGTTLTVYKENDSTAAWTGTVTTSASADPITGNDPA